MSRVLKALTVVVCIVGGIAIGSRTHVKVLGVYEVQDLLWILAVAVFFMRRAGRYLFPRIDKEFPPDS